MSISSEKKFFNWTYLLKKTPRWTKILISPVWNKILKIWDRLFDLIQIEVQCNKNYSKIFLLQEAWASGNNIEKDPKSHVQNWKIYILNIYREYLLCAQSNESGSFSQTCINFVEQWFKSSHFEGSIMS